VILERIIFVSRGITVYTHTHTYTHTYTHIYIYIYILFLHLRSAAGGSDASQKLTDLAVRLMYFCSNCDIWQAEQGAVRECRCDGCCVLTSLLVWGLTNFMHIIRVEQIVQNFTFSGELPKARSRPYRT
jgi:hypothetical protein